MEQKYYCKKRCKLLDEDFKLCETCFKTNQSGFTDLDMCQQFNISYYEDKIDGNNTI